VRAHRCSKTERVRTSAWKDRKGKALSLTQVTLTVLGNNLVRCPNLTVGDRNSGTVLGALRDAEQRKPY